MNLDFIKNGQATGNVAQRLLACGMNANVMREYSMPTGVYNSQGEMTYEGTYISVFNSDGNPMKPLRINNAQALLRKDDWLMIDKIVTQAATIPLKLVSELRSRNLVINTPGMAKTVLQSQKMSDISKAELSMNGVRESRRDRPVFELDNLPLPIIHKDFSFYLREIQASRSNGGEGLDVQTAALAAQKVAEMAEELAVGSVDYGNFAGGHIYGILNYPDRLTKELTTPGSTGWTGATLIHEIIEAKAQLRTAKYYGPYLLLTSPGFDDFLDEDYSSVKGTNTLRQRIGEISGIDSIVTIDYFTGLQMVLLQLTPAVIREVVGMDITTLQWELHGGMEIRFKVMAMLTPQIRSDIYGNTGIVHMSTEETDLD